MGACMYISENTNGNSASNENNEVNKKKLFFLGQSWRLSSNDKEITLGEGGKMAE